MTTLACQLCGALEIDPESVLACHACWQKARAYFEGGHIRHFLRWFAKLGVAVQRGDYDLDAYQKTFLALSESVRKEITECLGTSGNPNKHKRALIFEPMQFQKPFYLSGAMNRGAFWANQVGKSLVLAIILRNFCTGDYPEEWPENIRFKPPTLGRLWIPSFGLVKAVFLPKWLEWLDDWPSDHQSNDAWEIRKNHQQQVHEVLHNPTGSMFDVCSTEQFDQNPVVGEGWQGHYSIADEPLRQAAYTATARGLIRRKGQFTFGGTLLTEPWMTREFIRKQRPGVVECFFASMDENLEENGGFLSRQHMEQMLETAGEMERQTRRYGTPTAVLGAYFPELSDPATSKKIFIPIEPPIPADYEVFSITDYHMSTPIHTVWCAIAPWGQFRFFEQLIQGHVSPTEYVDMMLATERRWGVRRLKCRLVDRSIDVDYNVEMDDGDYLAFNPYVKFNEVFDKRQSITFRKVTGAQGSLDVVRELIKARWDKRLEMDVQPFVIGHHCEDLIATLPDASPATYKSGPMSGENKDEMDKKKVRGAHSIDCFLYGMASGFTWDTLAEMPPAPGTVGHLLVELAEQDEHKGEDVPGNLVGVAP